MKSIAPDFSCTPERIRSISAGAILSFERDLAEVLQVPKPRRTFENTVVAFENAIDELVASVQVPQFLALVSAEEEVRKASEELRSRIGKYLVGLMTREDIFGAFMEYAEKKEPLSPMDARLLEKRLRDFRKSGLGLEPRKRSAVGNILKELVDLNLEFQKNLRAVSDSLEVTAEELKGLPEDYVARLKRGAGGGYIITMNYPDYNPFMENSESGDARRRLCRMFNDRCAAVNRELLERAILLRRKLAKLLGYASYADYLLDDRMAKNSKTVFSFLERLRLKLQRKAKAELKERLRLKSAGGKSLHPWETAYYSNLLKKTKYNMDHEKIKEYFPLEAVLKGMLEVFGELIGAEFVPARLSVWHKDVRAYEVKDLDGSPAGYFYLDLFPREGKYKHVICSSLRSGRELNGGEYELPAAAILANFTFPAGKGPILLKFSEVQTLFHEFGHVLQLIFSRAKYSRLASVNAAWDFVEIPSTALEHWIYEPAVLRRVSGHYRDNKLKLPDDAIKGLISARNMDSGLRCLRLIAMGMIDMRYHTGRDGIDANLVYKRTMKKIALVGPPEDSHPEASFGHIMGGGYTASYYSYIWAEVVAADIFGAFKASGVLDRHMGELYRDLILAPGASLDEAGQIEKFLGRPFSEATFLESVGAI